jgi:hypothetical protein
LHLLVTSAVSASRVKKVSAADSEDQPYLEQTRAEVNTLWLSCHILNEPEARVGAATKTVTILDGMIYDLAAWESAPKISAGYGESRLLHRASDANSGKKTVGNDAEANCLSCHGLHGTQKPCLLQSSATGRTAGENHFLGDCRNFMGVNGVPKNVRAHQGPYFGGQL